MVTEQLDIEEITAIVDTELEVSPIESDDDSMDAEESATEPDEEEEEVAEEVEG